MRFFYNGVEKGTINANGEVEFVDKDIFDPIKKKMFFTLKDKKTEDGGVLFIPGEVGIELKISILKSFGFKMEDNYKKVLCTEWETINKKVIPNEKDESVEDITKEITEAYTDMDEDNELILAGLEKKKDKTKEDLEEKDLKNFMDRSYESEKSMDDDNEDLICGDWKNRKKRGQNGDEKI